MQGKYLKNGVCVQGGSILCLAAYGMYDTNCDTGNYGCPQYAVAQVDAQTQNQMSVCRVVHAAKMYEFVYGIAQTICSS